MSSIETQDSTPGPESKDDRLKECHGIYKELINSVYKTLLPTYKGKYDYLAVFFGVNKINTINDE